MTALAALNSQVEGAGQHVETVEVKQAQETPNEQPASPG